MAITAQALLSELGVPGALGHLLFALDPRGRAEALDWLRVTGLAAGLESVAKAAGAAQGEWSDRARILDEIDARIAERWAEDAGLCTRAEAADFWDPEAPRTPDGFCRVRGGLEFAASRSVAASPFADLLWMETKTPDLEDARRFAEIVHAAHPDAMLAYNLSPSFNWDSAGMSDQAMREFPDALGRLGFVFTFITYGGHQLDGLATEAFSDDLRRDGMLALARRQRRLRLTDSPYRTPQALVGGPREDAALMASTGRTAATQAMGARSTHHQHLIPVEPGPSDLVDRLTDWAELAGVPRPLSATLRPHHAWSDALIVRVMSADAVLVAEVFATSVDVDSVRQLIVSSAWSAAATPSGHEAVDTVVSFLIDRTKAQVALRLEGPSERDDS